MNKQEALTRIKTGNFNGDYGFDMQLLIDTVGIIGELFKNGQISETATILKEQKAVEPIYNEEKFGDFLPHCPVCKKVLPSISQYGKSNFCYRCGQELK